MMVRRFPNRVGAEAALPAGSVDRFYVARIGGDVVGYRPVKLFAGEQEAEPEPPFRLSDQTLLLGGRQIRAIVYRRPGELRRGYAGGKRYAYDTKETHHHNSSNTI